MPNAISADGSIITFWSTGRELIANDTNETIDVFVVEIPNDNEESNELNDKTTVCHKGKKSLVISEHAVQEHIKHGDVLGTCD